MIFMRNQLYVTDTNDLTIDFATALCKHNNYMKEDQITVLMVPAFCGYLKVAMINEYSNTSVIRGFYNNIKFIKNIEANIVPNRNYNSIKIENTKNLLKSLF